MSAPNSNQPSTIKSYVDSASATIQNAVGSLTGNPVDKQVAADRHVDAQAERDASRAGAKVGPLTFSTAGVTTDNQDRTGGKKDQMLGSGKEFMGNMTGSEQLKREGRQQNAEGQGREAAGQIKDYTGGMADRVTGTLGSVAAAVVGNPDAQNAYQKQHDTGKTNVRGVEAEVNKH